VHSVPRPAPFLETRTWTTSADKPTATGFLSALALWLIKPRHRGITHHPLAAWVFGALVFAVSQNSWAALNGTLAYGMHLVADRFS